MEGEGRVLYTKTEKELLRNHPSLLSHPHPETPTQPLPSMKHKLQPPPPPGLRARARERLPSSPSVYTVNFLPYSTVNSSSPQISEITRNGGVAVVGALKRNQLAVMLNQALLPVGAFLARSLSLSLSSQCDMLPAGHMSHFRSWLQNSQKNIMCLVNFHQEISMVSFTAPSAGSLRCQCRFLLRRR